MPINLMNRISMMSLIKGVPMIKFMGKLQLQCVPPYQGPITIRKACFLYVSQCIECSCRVPMVLVGDMSIVDTGKMNLETKFMGKLQLRYVAPQKACRYSLNQCTESSCRVPTNLVSELSIMNMGQQNTKIKFMGKLQLHSNPWGGL